MAAALQLAMNEEERRTLVEVLSDLLPSLREEVYKTESYDLRQQLKHREAVVKALLTRLDS